MLRFNLQSAEQKVPPPLALPHPFKKLHSGPCAGPRRRLTGKAILPRSSSRHTGCPHRRSPGQPGEHQAGSPYPLVVPHSGKIFEPFLPPLSPERPRPAGTSTPSAAFLSPQSGTFSHHLSLPVVMTGHAVPSGNLRKRPAFPEGPPSVPFSGTSRCPRPSDNGGACRPHPNKRMSGMFFDFKRCGNLVS